MTTRLVLRLQDRSSDVYLEAAAKLSGHDKALALQWIKDNQGTPGPPITFVREVTLAQIAVDKIAFDEIEDVMCYTDDERYIDGDDVYFSPNFDAAQIAEWDFHNLFDRSPHVDEDGPHPSIIFLTLVDSDYVGSEAEAVEILLNEGWKPLIEPTDLVEGDL